MGGGMPPVPSADPNAVKAAHTDLQRALLGLLADSGGLAMPISFDGLLRVMFERFSSLRSVEGLLGPSNVEVALRELSNLVNPVHPGSVRFDGRELLSVDEAVLRDFQQRLMGRPAAPPEAPAEKKGRKLSTGGLGVDDEEEAEIMDLLGKKSIKQQEKQEQTDELLELLNKPTAKQSNEAAKFRTAGGSKLKEFCRNGTKEECAQKTGMGPRCQKIHFRRIIKPHTDVSLGDCSYLDTCRHMATCKFIHYEARPRSPSRSQHRAAARLAVAQSPTRARGGPRSTRRTRSGCGTARARSTPLRASRATAPTRTCSAGTTSRSSSTATSATSRWRCWASSR
jgi:hypothetical protein